MARQLNVRVSDVDYLVFERIQETLKEHGYELNQRELIEMMIRRTDSDLKRALALGKELGGLW